MPPRILCLGMPVRDLLFRITDLPQPGAKIRAEHVEEVSGGNAPNAAIAIARLGGRVRLSGPIGAAHEPGTQSIFDQLNREGIETRHLVRVDGTTTAISSIMIDATGERTAITWRDPKLWRVKLPDAADLLDGVDAVLTENRCAEFVTEICTVAHARGIPVVLDADRANSLPEGLLAASSHVIFSADALRATTGEDNLGNALKRIAGLTTAFLAVTNGAQGVIWLDGHHALHEMPAFPIHPVDTLGAGDVFHGAFALAIAEALDIEAALRFSSAAAALKCTRFGGAFGAPQRTEVEALLGHSSVTGP